MLVACIAAPFLANTFGWLFTEMGRQPWIVYGLMNTAQAFSPGVSATDVAITLGGFVLLYTRARRHRLRPHGQDGPARLARPEGGAAERPAAGRAPAQELVY